MALIPYYVEVLYAQEGERKINELVRNSLSIQDLETRLLRQCRMNACMKSLSYFMAMMLFTQQRKTRVGSIHAADKLKPQKLKEYIVTEILHTTTVDGTDVENMNDQAIFNKIAKLKKELTDLVEMDIAGAASANAKADLETKIEELTDIVNDRYASDDE